MEQSTEELLRKARHLSAPDSGLVDEVRGLLGELANKVEALSMQESTVSPKVRQLPTTCDGKEQDAFEAFARSKGMDTSVHPLHWLFLDDKTSSAREGWRGALEYVQSVTEVVEEVAGGDLAQVAGFDERGRAIVDGPVAPDLVQGDWLALVKSNGKG